MDVTLHIPALFPRFPEIDPRDIEQLSLPGLSTLLAKATTVEREAKPHEQWLYERFTGLDTQVKDIPFASLTARMDGLDAASGWWLRADPVYLYPDTHSLVLQDPKTLGLSKDECDELARDLEPLFSDYGATFHAPSSARWYLRFDGEPPEIECIPVQDVVMQPVNNHLPSGTDSRRWHTLFNEIQMVLNQASVNKDRELSGRQPVNSLWFWGLGKQPVQSGPVCDCCMGGGEYVQSLCLHTNSRHKPLMDGLLMSRYQNSALIVDDRLLDSSRKNDPQQWLSGLRQIDQEIIVPMVEGLKAGGIRRLEVVSDTDIAYQCTSTTIRAFWKRPRPVSRHLIRQ